MTWLWQRLAALATALLAILAALGAVFQAGRRSERHRARARALEENAKDEAAISKALADRANDDPGGARERLRRFGGDS